ncbi:universal stress protein [Rugamonas sp. DEMB1]|jgi:nucleotide-binding universal stress UspA family protein|uniref:universal stress protein n=1 Tax=Rugamonas sp. DEMB1 TaxID=3039386 RepID=UPI00244A5144|nr:universal stress protein [Rugamonas sp. DEMB1]WGG50936.1 universal stress protein [Rugamonas sp. DEMB1]
MKKILVPCDGSDNALRAVRHAATSARENPSIEIELLHVLDPMTFKSQAALLSPDELSRLCPDEANHVLQPARRILEEGAIPYRVRCRVGPAAGEIAAQVHESGSDGVIMGTRGMGQIASVMIGSVASRVVHLVDVPVTLVK